MKKLVALVAQLLYCFLITTIVYCQLLEENFNYVAGTNLSDHGWDIIRGGSKIRVTSPGLSYAGYASSGIGNAVSMNPNGEELVRKFAAQSNGQIYVTFMVNVSDAIVNDSPNYLLYLGGDNISISSRRLSARVRKDENDKVAFGVGKISISTSTDYKYELNATHLIVIKYKFSADIDDTVSLWVNPPLEETEPSPERTISTGTDAVSLSEIVLTQINGEPVFKIDGIRITTEWNLLPTGVMGRNSLQPAAARLYQNYPNPFNMYTEIIYDLSESDHANVKIYNLMGHEIRTLLSRIQGAGQYAARWDGRNNFGSEVTSGIYIYSLKTTRFSQSRKMLLVK